MPGHSSAAARRTQVRRLVLIHHDPASGYYLDRASESFGGPGELAQDNGGYTF